VTSDARALRIAVLSSFAAPGLETLLAHSSFGSVFELVAVIGSESSFAEAPLLEEAGVPLILMPAAVAADRSPWNLHARREFDSEAAQTLLRLNADYLVLIGYRYPVTEALLESFPHRIIALHDGDLTLLDENGQRKYKGAHAVTDAIMAGEPDTRSSAYLVTSRAEEGPLLLLGPRYRVPELARDARQRGAADMLCRYAELHRQWMSGDCWGPMTLRVIELLAAGVVHVVGDVVWVDGVPAPCLMGEAPNQCFEHESHAGIPRACPFIK
jgi:phosphoribosylglycinamide formyltransferase-1